MNAAFSVVSSISSLAPESGGPTRSTTALCSALAAVGIDVRLVSLNHGNRYQPAILPKSADVQTQLVPCFSSKQFRVQWSPRFRTALLKHLKNSASGIIHDNGAWSFTNCVAAQAARLAKVPLIVSPRGMLNPWAVRYKSWKKRLGWHLFQHQNLLSVTAFHATSAEEAEGLRQLGMRQPIAIIPNGVELPALQIRQPSESRTALFLGRVHPVKGLIPLVKAWAKVRPESWRMIIAGPDEDNHRAELEALIASNGLAGQFQFTGLVEGEAKAKLFYESDLFILPSFSENFSIATAEALAHGLPVLTTKGTPWKELPARNCGWWVDVSVDSLAAALTEATQKDLPTLRAMGESGREYVEQAFSWSKIGLEMRAFYEWVLGIGSKPQFVVSS